MSFVRLPLSLTVDGDVDCLGQRGPDPVLGGARVPALVPLVGRREEERAVAQQQQPRGPGRRRRRGGGGGGRRVPVPGVLGPDGRGLRVALHQAGQEDVLPFHPLHVRRLADPLGRNWARNCKMVSFSQSFLKFT